MDIRGLYHPPIRHMTIDRDNYESFFLRYTDHELSVDDKKAVDDFVALHPDLREELDSLLRSVLKPEPFHFTGKSQLFRMSESTQEQLLSMLDGELDTRLATDLTEAIATNPLLQQEWQLLQKTQSDPGDIVVFENKALLYRQAPARVIAFRWWRLAAAAVLAGFGTWAVIGINRTYNDKNPVAVVQQQGIPATTPHIVATPGTGSNTTLPATASSTAAVTPSVSDTQKLSSSTLTATVAPKQTKTVSKSNVVIVTDSALATRSQQRKPLLQNINNLLSNENELPDVTSVPAGNNDLTGKNDVALVAPPSSTPAQQVSSTAATTTAIATIAAVKTSPAVSKQASFDDNGQEPGTKTILRGLLRKIKRVFVRNTGVKPDGGKGIMVANFEIAAR